MKTLTLILCLTLLGCKNSKTSAQNINAQTPEYKAYMAQEHRFSLNRCELTYNEKSFSLGMTLQEVEKVFGKEYKVDRIDIRNQKRLLWESANISITFFEEKAIYIYIYMETDVYKINEKKQIKFIGVNEILLDGIVLTKNDKFQHFIEKSTINFDDFYITSDGYKRKMCLENKIRLNLDSRVDYERIGSGHIYMRGDWLLDKTKPVESISISYKNK